jgi:rubrerythrin
MMDKYISREGIIEELEEEIAMGDKFDENDVLINKGLKIALKYIKRHPAADVRPVKHGYWKEEEPRVLKCSVCGEYAPMNYLGQNCIDSSYCPWCGARMKETV